MMSGFPGKLLVVDENGNEIELRGTISVNEEPDLLGIGEKDILSDCSITNNSLSVDITSGFGLSKKKFVKMLMSKGIGRNGANEIAKYVLKKNGRYTMLDLMMW